MRETRVRRLSAVPGANPADVTRVELKLLLVLDNTQRILVLQLLLEKSSCDDIEAFINLSIDCSKV